MTLVVVLAAASARSLAVQETPAEGWYTQAQAARGRVLYEEHCAVCHGTDFVPDDFSPGLTGAAFQWTWAKRTVLDLFESVQEKMPPDRPGTLEPQAAIDIVAYLLKSNDFAAGDTELAAGAASLRDMSLRR